MSDIKKPLKDWKQDEETADFLKNIQGNILKSHGRNHTRHLILCFKADSGNDDIRNWIAEFAQGKETPFGQVKVTSALEQDKAAGRWRNGETGEFGELFAMILISATGYHKLGLQLPVSDEQFPSMKKPINEILSKYDDVENWVPPYQDDVDAMILLAHNDCDELNQVTSFLKEALSVFCENAIPVEKGQKLTIKVGGKDIAIEHFGYADGISQPSMTQQEIEAEIGKRGNKYWNPEAAPELVLVKERGANSHYGSFMVFRKLRQDKAQFNERIKALGGRLKDERIGGDTNALAGALVFGRRRNGHPIIPTNKLPEDIANDFEFNERCPTHAHIRKVNSRSHDKRNERIVRRGITYGDGEQSDADVGLLFMSFQADLKTFETLQSRAYSSEGGVDPILGKNLAEANQTWEVFSIKIADCPVAGLVTLLGGEYFFAPSISFLTQLAVMGA